MTDQNKERKAQILKLIDRWTPVRTGWHVKLSLSFTNGGFLKIKHDKPIAGYRRFIEGLLAGAGLCPCYYPDGGPCDCWEPSITWEGPDE